MSALLVFLLAIVAGALYSLGLAAFVTYVPPRVAHLTSSLWHRRGQPRQREQRQIAQSQHGPLIKCCD